MALLVLSELPTKPHQVSSLSSLPEGAAGIRATLDAMIQAAREASTTIEIRNLAESIIVAVPAKDYRGELEAIQRWVMAHIRYTRDPITTETLKLPRALLESPQGDCDDQATLVAALAMSIGFPARFVAIGVHDAGLFEHVYAEVMLGTVWCSVETTEPVPIGWIPEGIVAKMVRHA
jgi:transglutaminase-like putative cysteine protease